jgi:hypothetical protein
MTLTAHPCVVLRSRMSMSYAFSPPCCLHGHSGTALLYNYSWAAWRQKRLRCSLVPYHILFPRSIVYMPLLSCTFGFSHISSSLWFIIHLSYPIPPYQGTKFFENLLARWIFWWPEKHSNLRNFGNQNIFIFGWSGKAIGNNSDVTILSCIIWMQVNPI